jgi:hypothetical protein
MDRSDDQPPLTWTDSLTRGKAQLEAGETVPLEPFMERLRSSIARMKARRDEHEAKVTRRA